MTAAGEQLYANNEVRYRGSERHPQRSTCAFGRPLFGLFSRICLTKDVEHLNNTTLPLGYAKVLMMTTEGLLVHSAQSPVSHSRLLFSACENFSTVIDARHGQVVSAPGATPDSLYFVSSGSAVSKKMLRDGRMLTAAISLPGDVIACESFSIGTAFTTTVALGKTELLRVPFENFAALMDGKPIYQNLFLRVVAYQGLLNQEWLLRMGRLSAAEKTAHFICEIFWRMDMIGRTDGNYCDFPFGQRELADVVGVSLVQQSRSLSHLRAQGLIEWSGKGFRIKDRGRLERFAKFDAAYLEAALPKDVGAVVLS